MKLRPLLLTVLLICVASCAVAATGAPPGSSDVRITLTGGAAPGGPAATRPAPDMVLDLSVRDGKWDKDVWGYAVWFNRAHHRGEATNIRADADGVRLSVKLAIAADPFVPGGDASYDIELTRNGDSFSGTYKGQFLGNAVEGAAAAHFEEPAVRVVPGVTRPQAGEHPRLIFRKADLTELKRRAGTPDGKAMLARLMPAGISTSTDDAGGNGMTGPLTLPSAITWGAVYQLTGDKLAAERSLRAAMDRVVKRVQPPDVSEVELSVQLIALAQAYDLCFDAWDPTLRDLVADAVYRKAVELDRGLHEALPIEGLNLYPWSSANAVRAGAVGVAAIALLGEKGSDGRPFTGLDDMIARAERDAVAYLRTGVSKSGSGLEGDLYLKFALANGLLPFAHADRTALGRDLGAANPLLLAGPLVEHNSGQDGATATASQSWGVWPMGFSTAPDHLKPALRSEFDHSKGLQGDGSLDCAQPYHAAYLLASYPFDVPAAKDLGALLPRFVTDRDAGRYVFRSGYAGAADDCVVLLNMKGPFLPGLHHEQSEPNGLVRLDALGTRWIDAPIGYAPQNYNVDAESTYVTTTEDRQALLGFKLDGTFLAEYVGQAPPARHRIKGEKEQPIPLARRGGVPAADADKIVPVPHSPYTYVDTGLKGTRSMAVDVSGSCGAPLLLAVVDRISGTPARGEWDLRLAAAGGGGGRAGARGKGAKPDAAPAPVGEAKMSGRSFTVTTTDGATLAGVFVPAPGLNVRAPGKATGAQTYFVVLTIQKGRPPDMKVDGEGLEAKVTVGGQRISFDGEKLVLAKQSAERGSDQVERK